MTLKCAVPSCKSLKNDNKISLFKFPMQVPVVLDQWIMAINRKDWTPTASSRICHLHFKTSDYSNTAGKVLRLKPDVVPTLNLHYVNADKDTCNIYFRNQLPISSKSAT